MAQETSRLLEAWRAAERAADAARRAAMHAQEAAEAAERSADAARLAAKDAGISLDEADRVVLGARKAYHNHDAELTAEDEENRRTSVPGAFAETT